jgi:uncharacterized membrane protein YphA (DoxX/SURF4 family)
MNRWASFFLILLRLSIGWHFLVEGYHKFHTHQLGVTATNKPWTGEAFFREGIGPAAQAFRDLLGDPDKLALARLKGDGQNLPAPVAADWDGYFNRFVSFYGLTDEQRAKAQALFDEAKRKTAQWLTVGKVEIKKTGQWGTVNETKTMPEWLAEWETKRQGVGEVYGRKLPAFNEDVEGARLRSLKSDANALRDDLLAALDSQTAATKMSLASVLTPEQKKLGEPPPAPEELRPIDYLDRVTMWSHMILGGFLLFGLFTRAASLGLALFLLSVLLVSPAVPWAPTPPGAVGHYLYVNLYVIEMIALFLLASVPTGQWFGLDAVLHYVFGRRRPLPPKVAPPGPVTRQPSFDYPTPRLRRE